MCRSIFLFRRFSTRSIPFSPQKAAKQRQYPTLSCSNDKRDVEERETDSLLSIEPLPLRYLSVGKIRRNENSGREERRKRERERGNGRKSIYSAFFRSRNSLDRLMIPRLGGISASSEKSSLGRHPSKERVEKWWAREKK